MRMDELQRLVILSGIVAIRHCFMPSPQLPERRVRFYFTQVLPIFYHEKVWSIFSPFLWCLCSQKGKAQQSRRADFSCYYLVFTI